MPYTYPDDIPRVAQNWTPEEQQACTAAANAVLADTGDEEQAVYACIHAAGRSEQAQKALGEVQEQTVKVHLDASVLTKALQMLRCAWQNVERWLDEPWPARPVRPLLKAGGMVVTKDAATGRRRWMGIPANALYPDAMGEGLSMAALQEAVERMMEEGTPQTEVQERLTSYVYPDRRAILDIAHIEFPSIPSQGYPTPTGEGIPLAVGTADMVGMCGPFVIATGLEDATPAGKAFFDYVEQHPEEDLRMSHLFEAQDADRRPDGVFQRVDLVRFSVAPASVVANEWTAFALADAKTTGGVKMQMDERLRPFLVGILGEEQVKMMESNLEEFLATAQTAGAEQRTKDAPPPPAEPAPPAEDPRIGELATQVGSLSSQVADITTALGVLSQRLEETKTRALATEKTLAELAAPAGVTTPPAEPIPAPGAVPAGTKGSVLDNPRYTFRGGQ